VWTKTSLSTTTSLETDLYYAVAELGDKVIARERVPLHVIQMPDDHPRKETYMLQISDRLKRRVRRIA
jgi:hypothetical protein